MIHQVTTQELREFAKKIAGEAVKWHIENPMEYGSAPGGIPGVDGVASDEKWFERLFAAWLSKNHYHIPGS